MRPRLFRGGAFVSWIALVVCGIVAGAAFARARRVAPLPQAAPATAFASLTALAPNDSDGRRADRDLPNDPFRPGRRLPNELRRLAAARPDTILPAASVAIRLLGTVVRPTGSFAVCQLPPDIPRIVHLGERVGEMTLITLEQGRAVFQTPKGARLELSLSIPRS